MLRWRGGLRENRRVFACWLIAAESSGVKFLEEKTGLNGGIQTCLWISDGVGVRNKQKV